MSSLSKNELSKWMPSRSVVTLNPSTNHCWAFVVKILACSANGSPSWTSPSSARIRFATSVMYSAW